MPTIPQRIASAFAVVCGRYGDVTKMAQDRERMRGDYNRLRQEAQEKIDKLMERIKELNQRLIGAPASGAR